MLTLTSKPFFRAGPSWSTVEFDGTPKLSHYAVARAFAPLLVSTTVNNDTLHVHMTSDLLSDATGQLLVEVFRWQDSPATPITSRTSHIVSHKLHSAMVMTISLSVLLAKAAATPAEAFLRLTFTPDEESDESSTMAESFHWLTYPKDAALPPAYPRVVDVTIETPLEARVRLYSNATAAFVSLVSVSCTCQSLLRAWRACACSSTFSSHHPQHSQMYQALLVTVLSCYWRAGARR